MQQQLVYYHAMPLTLEIWAS